MQVYYEDTDITDYVNVRSCVLTDTCGGRSDGLEMEFEDSGTWFGWEPREDDRIRLTHNGYDSGDLYLSNILPDAGRFRLWATSLPCKARAKQTRSYIGLKLGEILGLCASSAGLGYQLFGVEPNTLIPYVQQENESCAAFLRRLLRYEGAVLKLVNGKYTAIGVQYAQDLDVSQTIDLPVWQSGTVYERSGAKFKRLTIDTANGKGTATDGDVDDSHPSVIVNAPVRSDIQAARWARGLLLDTNRSCETLTVDFEFNAGFTSMARININSDTDAAGEWLIDTVEHDFIGNTSTATMHRCVRSIT